MSQYESVQRRARMKGIVATHSEAVACIPEPGDLAVVKRGTLRSVVMRCPDGCGETITLNLDPRTDKAWRLYQSSRGLTLFPSVWRNTGCRSHFILWNNVLYWVDTFDIDESEVPQKSQLDERIWAILKPDGLTDFVELADALEEIPWDVLDACRRLVSAKRAVEGVGSMKSCFRRL